MGSSSLPRSIYQRLPSGYLDPDSQFVIPDSQPPLNVEDMVATGNRPRPAPDTRKLTVQQLGLIVTWLEVPANFWKLHGAGTQTECGVRHPNKKTVYNVMLQELQACGFPWFINTGDNLGKRFQRYEAKYKEALIFKNSIGAGVTEAELAKGITFQDKLEKICPHFARLNLLYGERHNVAPPTLLTFGLPGRRQIIQTLNDSAEAREPEEGIPPDEAYCTTDPTGQCTPA